MSPINHASFRPLTDFAGPARIPIQCRPRVCAVPDDFALPVSLVPAQSLRSDNWKLRTTVVTSCAGREFACCCRDVPCRAGVCAVPGRSFPFLPPLVFLAVSNGTSPM
eukprot:g32398.t1